MDELSFAPLTEQITLVVAFVVMIISNIISTATTLFNDTNNKIISDSNPTYLSPDGATFSIWGFIYLFEAMLVVYQALPRFREQENLVKGRKWVILAFLLNAIWLPVFSFFRWWLALAIIAGYLYALYKSHEQLEVNYGSCADWHLKVCVFTGISLNFAWVVVATLLNVTVVARNSRIIYTPITAGVTNATSGFDASTGDAIIGGNVDWAVLCIVVASIFGIYRSVVNVDVPYTFVTAWALGGIYRMQTVASDTRFPVTGMSEDLSHWATVGFISVGFAGAIAIIRAIILTRSATKGKDEKSSELLTGQPLTSGDSDMRV